MNFKELLEAKTSTLKKYEMLSFIEFASEFPSELLRYIFDRIKQEGYKINEKETTDVKEFKTKSPLSAQNPWFNEKIEIRLKKSARINLSFELSETTIEYRISINFQDIIKKISALKSTKSVPVPE